MRILLIGATGTIGSAVMRLLSATHQIIDVGHARGSERADLAAKSSLEALFERVGRIDAIVSTAGLAAFGPLDSLTDTDFQLGLANKLMGQVNLVRIGQRHLNDNGSITLTSGILAQQPMRGSAAISLVNAGLEGFVRAAALELPRGLRINVVSPPWVTETAQAMGMPTANTLPAADVAKAYQASVEGRMTGQVLDARAYA